jgi:CMP/dCMP kinase
MNLNKLADKKSRIIIAVDGDSASGKGTICKKLSKEFELNYCQTSIFYRKLAKFSLQNNIDRVDILLKIATSNLFDLIGEEGIYSSEVSKRSSEIAAVPEIRAALNLPQNAFLETYDRVIMEGRDISTVIAPNADIKLFITAELDIRAKRRYNQLKANGENISLEDVKDQIAKRDERDKSRESAPLVVAKDAIILDSSSMDTNEFYDYAIKQINSILDKS